MKIIIGGSSSTGSSLLNQCLGRHRDILISPETSIYARPQLITHWHTYKDRILNWGKLKPLRSYGWHRENGINIPYDTWGVSDEDIRLIVERSENFDSFIKDIEQSILTHNHGTIWVEKTPANALTIPVLCGLLNDTLYITMVRHPLEAIASMINRGYEVLYACGIFLLNSSFGLSTDSDSCKVIRYEDFLENYQTMTERIITSVGLDPNLIDWIHSPRETKIDSWRHAEDELPQRVTHNRFQSLTPVIQREITNLVSCLRIKSTFQIAGQTAKYPDISSIAEATSYNLPETDVKVNINHYKRLFKNSLLKRTTLLDPINVFNSPFEIVTP